MDSRADKIICGRIELVSPILSPSVTDILSSVSETAFTLPIATGLYGSFSSPSEVSFVAIFTPFST